MGDVAIFVNLEGADEMFDARGIDRSPEVIFGALCHKARKNKAVTFCAVAREEVRKRLDRPENPHNIRWEVAGKVVAQKAKVRDILSDLGSTTVGITVRRVKDAMKEGKAAVGVDFGNSAAYVTCALKYLDPCVRGVKPAIALCIPRKGGLGHTVVTDGGAVIDCDPEDLATLAFMAREYYAAVFGKENPSFAILANGTELTKGNAVTRKAVRILEQSPVRESFLGYCEGRDWFNGRVDVVVGDGMLVNCCLKAAEGAADATIDQFKAVSRLPWFLKILFFWFIVPFAVYAWTVRRRFHADEMSGAAIIGVQGLLVISHSRVTKASALSAIEQAVRLVRHQDLPLRIARALEGPQSSPDQELAHTQVAAGVAS